MAVILTRGRYESVLFALSCTSNLELIHISFSETDVSGLTKEVPGPLLSFQGIIGDSSLLSKPNMGGKHAHESSDILLERQKFYLKITE